MDRSHTMVRLRQGALKLAIPTEVFDDLVRQAEKKALGYDHSGRSSIRQRQARVESLVWNHIWPNHPLPSTHDSTSQRNLGQSNQKMCSSVQGSTQALASTSLPRMGEFRYWPTSNRSHFPSSNAQPFALPLSRSHAKQQYFYGERGNNFPLSGQLIGLFPPPGPPYNPVHNAGAFHTSTKLQVPFASQSLLQPVGTGRPSPSTIHEGYHPVQIADGVSNRNSSQKLKPFESNSIPFSEVFADSQLQDFVQQQQQHQKVIMKNVHTVNLLPGTISTSYSGPRPDFPPRTFRKASNQLPSPINPRPQRRRASIPTRQDSQAEPHENRNKPGDTTFSNGIFKKRRNCFPRNAAVAACVAIANAAKIDMDSESEEGRVNSPKRTWAQVVTSSIKEENEETVALHGSRQTASDSINQEQADKGDCKTWAEVAAGTWKDAQKKEQKMRIRGFGKSHMAETPKHRRLFKNTKFDAEDVTGTVFHNSKDIFNHGPFTIRNKQLPAHGERHKRRASNSHFPKVAKDEKNWNTRRRSVVWGRKPRNGKN